jgi:hypothetical protein
LTGGGWSFLDRWGMVISRTGRDVCTLNSWRCPLLGQVELVIYRRGGDGHYQVGGDGHF